MRPKGHLFAAVLGLALAACTRTPDPVPDAGLVVIEGLNLAWQSGLPHLPQTSTVPPGWLDAQAQWQTATTAFSIGAYQDAGRGFMRLAEGLHPAEGEALDQTLRAARCMAYENAARAYRGTEARQEGIDKLVKARAQDPGCRYSITRVVGLLATQSATTAQPLAPVAPRRSP